MTLGARRHRLKRAVLLAAMTLAVSAAPVPALAESILFIGNSFTYGYGSAAWRYRTDSVHDLNKGGYGGMPAIFKRFAEESGLDYDVSLETAGGKDLAWHWENKRALLDRAWDHVVLQEQSALDPRDPGNPASLIKYAGLFADLFSEQNPAVKVTLDSTWTVPFQTFDPRGHWYGHSIFDMARDLYAGEQEAAKAHESIDGVAPVGFAFTRAIEEGVADANPYDGISFGQADLWTYDHYHASSAGIYLETLVIFARVTGRDPRQFGKSEAAATELGRSPDLAVKLQTIAWEAVSGAPCEHC